MGKIITSTVEIYKCEDFDLDLSLSIRCTQVDECVGGVTMRHPNREHFGQIFHRNSPGLQVTWDCNEPVVIGIEGEVQMISQPMPVSHPNHVLVTTPVRRGEGDFPLDLSES